MDMVFFASAAELRAWFEQNHETAKELYVGFYKKGSGKPSVTWPEAVDEALCFGWIDGVRKGIDDVSYVIRFTPRKPGSVWSATNIANVEKLLERGLMQPAGLKAFNERKQDKSAVYSYEQGDVQFDEAEEQQFRANPAAWAFFQAQAGSYRKACIWWVISAKQPATRQKRLATLIEMSEAGRTVPQFTRRTRST
ncbi:MAG: YdeI/OmpD-associated family protein [Chloroflexi bacterium]|nr:YdeI/OmpD-associated family protein [Chloroflexota bacterium]